ncbi:MAG: DMT family transporter [Syntrophaceae bacterium]|nr:DMT family transporter [Syntrophaceae bacterium]
MPILKWFLTSGFGLMLLAAFVFSLADVLTKYLTSQLPIMQIAFIRFLLGVMLLWPILSSRGISLRGNQTKILILRGLFGTLSFFCLLQSIALIPLANAIVLFYTFPLFVALFSFVFFKTPIEKGEILLIGAGLIGIYLLIDPDFHSFNAGYIFGILSSGMGGMAMVLIHQARQTNGPLIIYFYFCLIGGILSFPFFLRGFEIPDFPLGMLLIFLGLMLLIGQVLMNQGFKFCKASEGSLIMMSEIVFAGIAGFLIYQDPITLHFLIGALLIIGSGVGLNLMSRRSRRSPVSPNAQ